MFLHPHSWHFEEVNCSLIASCSGWWIEDGVYLGVWGNFLRLGGLHFSTTELAGVDGRKSVERASCIGTIYALAHLASNDGDC
jgi:hypothetical protein